MPANTRPAEFEQVILPHLDAAFNLARWLTRSDQDAEDVVQEACLRAFKFFDGFRGGDSRAWLLMIVRNTCYTWLRQNRKMNLVEFEDTEILDGECRCQDPAELVQLSVDREVLKQALEELPVEFREVIVLRELEALSYKEIAYIAHLPIGTVMSRLARARRLLEQSLAQEMDQRGTR